MKHEIVIRYDAIKESITVEYDEGLQLAALLGILELARLYIIDDNKLTESEEGVD